MKQLHQLFLKIPNTTLILLIALVYLYFMNDMMLRTTGDEKTYISQALEMQRDGSWFLQTWADESDYYKGPLHFILLRVGFMLFGQESMFATLYMNFFGLIVATLLLHRMLKEHLNDPSWALFYAGSFATSIGLYAHMFASQMEAELVILYAMTLYLLWKLDHDERWRAHLLLWSVIGLAGWLKSPAHSVFLAFSVLLYWIMSSQWRMRLKHSKVWWALLWGIGIGIAGYLPILIYDSEPFINNYIIKESLNKGPNGVGWETAFFPLFTYFLAPWMFAFVFALLLGVRTLFQKGNSLLHVKELTLVKLALAIIIPTLLFFTFHPYRGDIYALPAVSSSMLIGIIYWRVYIKNYTETFKWLLRTSALVLSIVPVGIIVMVIHFDPLPQWWPDSLIYFAVLGGLSTLVFTFYESRHLLKRGPALLIIAFIPLYWTLGIALESFGKAEMIDLENYIKNSEKSKPIGYYNVRRNVWSEYGYLNFWVEHRIVGIHTKASLLEWLAEGKAVIIPGERSYRHFKETLGEHKNSLHVIPWRRWLTHGKTASGESRFMEFWQSKDIRSIEQNFYIVSFKESL
ncbi:MAG: glycosyltransferase family 39 protein [Campylobacterota bacterium]|nr:glycosyltransferase family 39 protein [Campylobacterota bacterium]